MVHIEDKDSVLVSANLQNAGINVNADIRILHNVKENRKIN